MTKPQQQAENTGLDALFVALFNRSKALCFGLVFFITLGFIQSLNDLTDWLLSQQIASDAIYNYGFALLVAFSALRGVKAAAERQNR